LGKMQLSWQRNKSAEDLTCSWPVAKMPNAACWFLLRVTINSEPSYGFEDSGRLELSGVYFEI